MSTLKKINFFIPVAAKQADAKQRMRKIIHISILVCVIMAIITFLVYALQLKLNSDIDTLTLQTKDMQDQYTLQLANQTKLSIINTRLKTIINAEKTDIDFLAKQQKLENLMSSISTPKTINSLFFSPKGEFTAKIGFRSKADMKSFIAELEGQDFQNKVKLLTVSNFSFNLVANKDADNPEINITGEFL